MSCQVKESKEKDAGSINIWGIDLITAKFTSGSENIAVIGLNVLSAGRIGKGEKP